MVTLMDRCSIHRSKATTWIVGAVLMAAAFQADALPPLRVTVLIFASLTVFALYAVRVVELSVMTRLFIVLFSIPFSATLGYLINPEFVWTLGGNREALCLNHELINQMLLTAVVGLCGLMAGIEFITGRFKTGLRTASPDGDLDRRPTLQAPVFFVLLLTALYFSWLHSPAKTIFEAAYDTLASGSHRDVRAGVNGAYLISYLIIIFLSVDLELELSVPLRRFKAIGLYGVLGYIIVVLQFLRGDRESTGLIAALSMLYVTRPAEASRQPTDGIRAIRQRKVQRLLVPIAAFIVAFLALGTLRGMLREPPLDPHRQHWAVQYLTKNTWTAVSLNNLGLATEYHYGTVEYLHGKTYLDYLLSLPPRAFVLKFGIERPLDGPANPSEWYRCLMTMGGMHPVIVPFKNFGIWGVSPVMFLWGSLIGYCELNNERGRFSGRLLYGCLATSSMQWFWFGDFNLIRTLMMFGGLLVLHRVLTLRLPLRQTQSDRQLTMDIPQREIFACQS